MKSHSNSSPWACDLGLEVLGAVLPHEPHPALREQRACPRSGDVLGGGEDLDRPALAAAGRRGPSGGGGGDLLLDPARGSPAPCRGRSRRSGQPRDPRLPARAGPFAAMGVEALVADRAQLHRAHVPHPRRQQPRARHPGEVDAGVLAGHRRAPRGPRARPRSSRAPRRGRSPPTAARSRPSSRTAPTPSSSTPAARPRQPQWSIATAPCPPRPRAGSRRSRPSRPAPSARWPDRRPARRRPDGAPRALVAPAPRRCALTVEPCTWRPRASSVAPASPSTRSRCSAAAAPVARHPRAARSCRGSGR